MKRRLIYQKSHRLRNLPRYHRQAVDQLEELDQAIQECLIKPSSKNKAKARLLLQSFEKAVRDLIQHGLKPGRWDHYSVEHYGCWESCMCMVAHDLHVSFYPYESKKHLTPTVKNLLYVLRTWQILSPIAYSHDIVIDAMSVVTRGRVQLVAHRDFSESGIRTSLVRDQLIQLSSNKDIAVVICVKGHPALGEKEYSHWVVVHTAGPARNKQLLMRDPSRCSIRPFSYRTLYVICIYAKATRKSQIIQLFNSR